jgi:chemosensory pili system protein ChpA (sensor histidine kinase/response regulator)
MSVTDFDPGPLSWVKNEIDLALERAGEALTQYRTTADVTQLRFCRTHLHQVHGALEMIDLQGLPQITQSLESLLTAIEQGSLESSTSRLTVAEQTLNGIRSYLDALITGQPHQPMRLLPLLQAISEAHGLGYVSPSLLFFPDLTVRAPRREEGGSEDESDPEALRSLIKRERAQFQQGLLAWLRNLPDSTGAQEGIARMQQTVEAIATSSASAATRTFWWVTLGLLDGLKSAHWQQGSSPETESLDKELRSLLGRIDLQIRRLQDGAPAVPERVMREALYYIALLPQDYTTPTLAQIREAFQLTRLLPGASAASGDGMADPHREVLQQLQGQLGSAETLWNQCSSGNLNYLASFTEHLMAMHEQVSQLGNTDLKRLTQGLLSAAHWLTDQPAALTESAATEISTALALLRVAEDHFRELDANFAQQVDYMVQRLHGCILGRLPGNATDMPLLNEISRQARVKRDMALVVREVRSHLAQIEQVLDAYFRNPGQAQELAQLDTPLQQTAEALARIQQREAADHLLKTREHIHTLQTLGQKASQQDFEVVAERLSLLGFYVERLQSPEQQFAAFIDELQRNHGLTDLIADFVPAAAASPTPPVAAEVIPFPLETSFAPLPETSAEPAGEAKAQPLAATEGTPPAIAAETPASPAVETAPEAELDQQLLEIFIAEAHEVLETMQDKLAVLHANPQDVQALTTLRRSTHTLKGSGRMVGLAALGETAWAVEQTLNLWLRQETPVNAELMQLLELNRDTFARWVSHLEDASQPQPDPQPLIALAERLRGLEPLPAQKPVQTAPAATSPAAEDSTPIAPPPAASSAVVSGILPGMRLVSPEPVSAPTAPVASESASVPVLTTLTAPAMPAPTSDTAAKPGGSGGNNAGSGPKLKISPALFKIFNDEAEEHLQTLQADLDSLHANPDAPTPEPMARAAHTLGGICSTVGLTCVRSLCQALEHALLRRDAIAAPAHRDGLALLQGTLDTLSQQITGLQQQQEPTPQPELIEALAQLYPVPQPDAASLEARAAQSLVLPEVAESTEPAEPALTAALDDAIPLPADELDMDLLPVFLEEAEDLIHGFESCLQQWRAQPQRNESPHALARLLHTFKGGARMAGAMHLGEMTHRVETRLEQALSQQQGDAALIDEIEAACDVLVKRLEQLRAISLLATPNTATPLPDSTQLRFNVTDALGGGASNTSAKASNDAASAPAPLRAGDDPAQRPLLRVRADLIDQLVNEAGELTIARSRIEGEMLGLKGSLLDLTDSVQRLRDQLRDIEIHAESRIQSQTQSQAQLSPPQVQAPVLLDNLFPLHPDENPAHFDPLELDRFTRFQEITRAMAETVNDVATIQQSLLKNLDKANTALSVQARLNRSLQQELMGIRMLPFVSHTERLQRLVRQTAKEVGKQVNLEIHGGDVELDRSVLDRMLPPLEHMLRNAITHGLETPAQRRHRGKPELGEITVTVTQLGNEIQITVHDDGEGLNLEKIWARAQFMGRLTPGARPADSELIDLIFEPGFSTATEVTATAGRGVGMDVVKSEVSSMGGRIEVQTVTGQGSTFHLYLPVTLAVTQALLVRIGTQTYAIPASMIDATRELQDEELARWRQQGYTPWQGQRYNFHYLAHLLGNLHARPEQQGHYPVLLLRGGNQRIALQVDALGGNQEIVVKNVGPQLSRVVGIDGATVLANGQVILILNPVALAARPPLHGAAHVNVEPAPEASQSCPQPPLIMVVDDSLTVRKITSRLLEREGYAVTTAKDGCDALEKLRASAPDALPDVILTDIDMPHMDGFDLIKHIRADAALQGLPIIVITSRIADKHRNYASEIGANHFLGKPYNDEELLGLLRAWEKR